MSHDPFSKSSSDSDDSLNRLLRKATWPDVPASVEQRLRKLIPAETLSEFDTDPVDTELPTTEFTSSNELLFEPQIFQSNPNWFRVDLQPQPDLPVNSESNSLVQPRNAAQETVRQFDVGQRPTRFSHRRKQATYACVISACIMVIAAGIWRYRQTSQHEPAPQVVFHDPGSVPKNLDPHPHELKNDVTSDSTKNQSVRVPPVTENANQPLPSVEAPTGFVTCGKFIVTQQRMRPWKKKSDSREPSGWAATDHRSATAYAAGSRDRQSDGVVPRMVAMLEKWDANSWSAVAASSFLIEASSTVAMTRGPTEFNNPTLRREALRTDKRSHQAWRQLRLKLATELMKDLDFMSMARSLDSNEVNRFRWALRIAPPENAPVFLGWINHEQVGVDVAKFANGCLNSSAIQQLIVGCYQESPRQTLVQGLVSRTDSVSCELMLSLAEMEPWSAEIASAVQNSRTIAVRPLMQVALAGKPKRRALAQRLLMSAKDPTVSNELIRLANHDQTRSVAVKILRQRNDLAAQRFRQLALRHDIYLPWVSQVASQSQSLIRN